MTSKHIKLEAEQLQKEWDAPRWQGITRDYKAENVIRLRGSLKLEHTLARRGAEKQSLVHKMLLLLRS